MRGSQRGPPGAGTAEGRGEGWAAKRGSWVDGGVWRCEKRGVVRAETPGASRSINVIIMVSRCLSGSGCLS